MLLFAVGHFSLFVMCHSQCGFHRLYLGVLRKGYLLLFYRANFIDSIIGL